MSKLNVPAKINKARAIVAAIAANSTTFTTPNPSLPTLVLAINALETAWNNAQDGGKNKTAVMHDREADLVKLMFDIAAYVQNTANGIESIIHLAAMDVKKMSIPPHVEFSVERGNEHGAVQVRTKAVARGTFIWQYSADPITETSWIEHSQTTLSKIVVNDLTPGLVYWFRVALVDRDGKHEFNTPISIMVV